MKPLWIVILALLLVLCRRGHADFRAKRSDDPVPLETTVEQQARTISQLQAQVSTLSTKFATLEGRVAKQEKGVAFNVRLSEGTSRTFTGHENLVLDAVDLNTGHGYDRTTGMFTAPVPGLYVFSLHITHTPPGRLHVAILKNGHGVAEVEASGDDTKYLDRSSNSVVVHLNAGDKVWVQRADGSSNEIQGSFRTSFAGILVIADP